MAAGSLPHELRLDGGIEPELAILGEAPGIEENATVFQGGFLASGAEDLGVSVTHLAAGTDSWKTLPWSEFGQATSRASCGQ